MAAICPSALHLCFVRITRVSAVGEPVPGPNNVYVSDTPLDLAINPDILAGEVKDVKGGCDQLVATYRGQDITKRFNLELTQAIIDPALEEMLCGGSIVLAGEDPIGVNFPAPCGTQQPFVAIEAWQDLYDCDHQPSEPYQYRRYIFPSSRWVRGPETAQNDFSQPKFTGFTVGNANWGVGIFGDLTNPVGANGQWVFDNTLPTAACGYQTQPIS